MCSFRAFPRVTKRVANITFSAVLRVSSRPLLELSLRCQNSPPVCVKDNFLVPRLAISDYVTQFVLAQSLGTKQSRKRFGYPRSRKRDFLFLFLRYSSWTLALTPGAKCSPRVSEREPGSISMAPIRNARKALKGVDGADNAPRFRATRIRGRAKNRNLLESVSMRRRLGGMIPTTICSGNSWAGSITFQRRNMPWAAKTGTLFL